MQLQTTVSIAPMAWHIEPSDHTLCLGSCFAERIGNRMRDSQLSVCVNPSGTLYNPASIAQQLDEQFEAWQTDADSLFTTLIITLGTTHVFLRDGRVVANCQKLPAHMFTERDLSVDEIVSTLGRSIDRLHELSNHLRVLLTVSPYRYANWTHEGKNSGLHGNQLSKARLLLAVDEIVRQRVDYCAYFPAYEIMLDELRDYRFYDADMLHPSPVAVEYIWGRFVESVLSERCQRYVAEMEPIRKALAHRPNDSAGDAYQRFIADTLRRRDGIKQRYLSF